MLKKLILFTVLIGLFAGSFVLLHNYFGSDKVQALTLKTATTENITFINYQNIQEYTENNPGSNVFILADDQADSNYLLNNLIASIATENQGTALPKIVVVDLTDEKDMTVTRLKLQFGVETYPAIINGTYDSKLNIVKNTSSLIYNSKAPLTQQVVKKWFFDNKLWNGPFND